MSDPRLSNPSAFVGEKWLPVLTLLLLYVTPAQAQHQVSGRVTKAASGEPISGVHVAVRGTAISGLTDPDGRYTLTAPSSSGVLVFSLIGYARQAVPFEGQNVVDAILSPAAIEVEGVVVIGYGEKVRALLTESVGTVSREQIREVPIASPEVAIQGRVSGIQVQSESGNPGAPVALRIRGVGTVGRAHQAEHGLLPRARRRLRSAHRPANGSKLRGQYGRLRLHLLSKRQQGRDDESTRHVPRPERQSSGP